MAQVPERWSICTPKLDSDPVTQCIVPAKCCFIDLRQLDFLTDQINRGCKTTACQGKLVSTKVTTRGMGGTANITFKCDPRCTSNRPPTPQHLGTIISAWQCRWLSSRQDVHMQPIQRPSSSWELRQSIVRHSRRPSTNCIP